MNKPTYDVFLSYNDETADFVESTARRLRADGHLSFWFEPWNAIPGNPIQEQMEEALCQSKTCAVFIGTSGNIEGWQNTLMRAAILTRVEDDPDYRVIPVLLPGVTQPKKRELPRFLRLFKPVQLDSLDDEQGFRYLLSGILGIPPIQVDGFMQEEASKQQRLPPTSGRFEQGHALTIGVANYQSTYLRLPSAVLNDARAIYSRLTDPTISAYPPDQVSQLLDAEATGDAIRGELAALAARTGPDDTAIVYFSGHGARTGDDANAQQYLLPYESDPSDLAGTTISAQEMTDLLKSIPTGRLLVLFDACHSGGGAEPKTLSHIKHGLTDNYYAGLAQGNGRVVIASSRPDELSWVLANQDNSLFTQYLLEALGGQAKTLSDGYVRVFDLFRHVAEHVPAQAASIGESQHPIFKAAAMEQDFPVALVAT